MDQSNITITLKDIGEPNLLYRLLRKLAEAITGLVNRVNNIEQTKMTVDYGAVRKALQSTGSTPLNVQGLLGVLTQPQPAGAARLTAVPTGSLLQTYYDTQLLVVQNGSNYDLYSVQAGNPTTLIQLLAGGGPGNMVTTNTAQNITAQKTFTVNQIFNAKISTYDSIATAGEGVAFVVGALSLTGQTSAIGATNVATSVAAGLYMLIIELEVTTAGTGGKIELNVTSTDRVGAFTQSNIMSITGVTGGADVTVNGRTRVIYPTYAAASSNIQVSTTFTGVTGSPAYAIDACVIRMV